MNKTLKWILISLGILVGLLIIAALVFHAFAFNSGRMGMYFNPNGLDRDFDRGLRTFGRMPMMGFMPMMGLGLLRGVFGLGILALAVIGVVLLIRNGNAKHAEKMAAAQTAAPETPVIAQEPEINCKKCGKTLQKDWAVCPYCGKRQ